MPKISVFIFLCVSCQVIAQPFIDIAKINYSYSPAKGLNHKSNPLKANLISIGVNLPLELKKGGDAFIINPFFDHDQGRIATNDFHVMSQGLFLGFLKRNLFEHWDITTAFIVRRNKDVDSKLDHDWQYGGIILTTWRKNNTVSLKLGLYFNKEFFGNYFIPLAGIDWKISPKNNLFGVLPGNLVLEHKINQRFYCGFSFRALTNSYRLRQTVDPCLSGDCSARNYLRVDDNQLGAFADFYVYKKFVLTAESGSTILRRYRFGLKGNTINNNTDYKNDNYYFRLGLSYRIRFR